MFLIILFLFTGAYGRTLDEIRRSGKIYVAFSPGDLESIDYDLALEFARYLNVELIEIHIEWEEVFMRNGSIPSDLETNPEFSKGCPSGSFAEGELVELYSSPDSGWEVKGWSGTDDDTNTTNKNLYKIKLGQGSAQMVAIFEADLGRNGFGGIDDVVLRHDQHQGTGCNIAFADGHIEFVDEDRIAGLQWTVE